MAKPRLLIVEDDVDISNMLRIFFGAQGYDVETAYRGSEALEKTRQTMPQLIILDIMLPDIDGYEVCRNLRLNARTSHIPVIFLTQKDERSDKLKGLEMGADNYITKPFDIEEMLAAIERALQEAPGGQPALIEADAAISEKLASQEREIQHLRSLVQQQARTLQELQRPGQQTPAATDDVARWQTLVKEEEAKLATLKKQTITQHRALSRQISDLQAQLAEKDTILASLQDKVRQAGSSSEGQSDGQDLSLQLAEKEKALQRVNKLAESLSQVVTVHQQSLEKHREEAERVARELHVLAAAIQMLGQDLSDQANQMADLVRGDK